jgi:adenylate cyclase, class 2
MLEREVKLAYTSIHEARAAVAAAGASLVRPRRLQRDTLFDTAEQSLRERGCALRVRHDAGRRVLTFKGPIQPAAMKLREEFETSVEDGGALVQLLAALGYSPWFTYEKYREEYSLGSVIVAIDETPVGTFVELEGDEAGILSAASGLRRRPDDFILQSYRSLFLARREELGLLDDMVFADS